MAFDLDFEQPLQELEQRIQQYEKLERYEKEIQHLQQELKQRLTALYRSLTPWQRVQVARHKDRPYTADYIRWMCEDFFELHGDRRFADDRAIIGGLANIDGHTVMLIGHQKGRTLQEKQECSYGMAHPEGYRKALRLLYQAEHLHLPVVTLIDTPGAFPGLEDEQRGIAQAIAENLQVMAHLRIPIISIIIGEGGSGGALGLGIADRLLMMEHAIYTVASPEAAAAILWRDSAQAPEAAQTMKITAPELLELGLIDGIVPEPPGGAHQDGAAAARAVKEAILVALADLEALALTTLLDHRYRRYRSTGVFAEAEAEKEILIDRKDDA